MIELQRSDPPKAPQGPSASSTSVGEGGREQESDRGRAFELAADRILAWYAAELGDGVECPSRRRAVVRTLRELVPSLGLTHAESTCVAAIEAWRRRPEAPRSVWRVFGRADNVLAMAREARAKAAADAEERRRRRELADVERARALEGKPRALSPEEHAAAARRIANMCEDAARRPS